MCWGLGGRAGAAQTSSKSPYPHKTPKMHVRIIYIMLTMPPGRLCTVADACVMDLWQVDRVVAAPVAFTAVPGGQHVTRQVT